LPYPGSANSAAPTTADAAADSELNYRCWKWCAKNGFNQVRDFAEQKCLKEIYSILQKKDGLEKLIAEGIPWPAVSGLVSRSAQYYADKVVVNKGHKSDSCQPVLQRKFKQDPSGLR
jgi:hypothetical protein